MNPRILLVGCGNMGRAMLDGWLASGEIAAGAVTVADPVAEVPAGVALLREIPAQSDADLVVLAVKPQLLDAVAPRLLDAARGKVLLSIVAGTEAERLRGLVPGARVARMMANLAAAFGLSPVALHGPGLDAADRTLVERVVAPLGPVQWFDDERLLHAVTALGGSGPGFVYRFLAALAKAGEGLGLPAGQAAAMALATVRGATELAARSGEGFGALAARVASPGGTTEAGLAVLEDGAALDRLIAATLRAAHDRSEELAG